MIKKTFEKNPLGCLDIDCEDEIDITMLLDYLKLAREKGCTNIRFYAWDIDGLEDLEMIAYYNQEETDEEFEKRKIQQKEWKEEQEAIKLNQLRVEYNRLGRLFGDK